MKAGRLESFDRSIHLGRPMVLLEPQLKVGASPSYPGLPLMVA
jgi:hypothetical protein